MNVDIIRSLAEILHKIAELDLQILTTSPLFPSLLHLFHDTLLFVNERDTNSTLLLFFSFLVSSPRHTSLILPYLELLTTGLLCSVQKEQQLLEKIANALVVLMNNSEQYGFEQRLKEIVRQAMERDMFHGVSERAKKVVVEVLFGLKESKQKVRLVLVNLNGLVNGVIGEDSLIGLEMEAQNAGKLKEARRMQGGSTVVVQLE